MDEETKAPKSDLKTGAYQEAQSSTGAANKPVTGISSEFDIQKPGGGVINVGTNATTKVDPSNESARVGDYVIGKGGLSVVVPNSETDFKQRYKVISGASKMRDLTLGDFTNAAVTGLAATLGAPTDSSSTVGLAASLAVNSLIAKTPFRGAWGLLNAAKSLQDAQQRALEDFLNQSVEYGSAVDFEYNDKGEKVAVVDHDMLAYAGYGSGAGTKKDTDTSNSGVTIDGDNVFNVRVSRAFAESDRYKEILENLKEKFPGGITEQEANTVVDEETGSTLLDVINSYVTGEEVQYYYDAESIKYYRDIVPNASVESLEMASATHMVSFMNKDNIEKTTIEIVDADNPLSNLESTNANTYLEGISKMSDRERDDYMLKLAQVVETGKYSTDEALTSRAVLAQAQINILYGVSNNEKSGYEGIYKKGFWDTIADASDPVFGLRVGNYFGSEQLQTFEDDPVLAPLLLGGSSVIHMLTLSRITNVLEKLSKGGTSLVGKVIPGKAGQLIQKAANSGNSLVDFGYMAAADLAYEGMKYGAASLTGEEMDFLAEFKTDLLIDAIIKYGPSSYVEAMNRPVYERRRFDPETGKEASESLQKSLKGQLKEWDVKFVRVSADELAMRRAKTIDKLTDNKLAIKVAALFSDKNTAMGKLAIQLRAAGADGYLFRRMVRFSNDLRMLTSDTFDDFIATHPGAAANYAEFMSKFNEVAPKKNGWTKADQTYLKAYLQNKRFSYLNRGDEAMVKKINKFYSDGLNSVSPERAAELQGLLQSGYKIFNDVLNFYEEEGLIDKASKKKLISASENGEYWPVWTQKDKLIIGEANQGRTVLKKINDPSELIPLDELEDPLLTLGSYINNSMRNVAINRRALAIRQAANTAGVKIRVTKDTGGGLGEVENLREMRNDFQKIYDGIVSDVEKEVPTQEEWNKRIEQMYMRSNAAKSVEELKKFADERRDLENEYRRVKRARSKDGIDSETLKDLVMRESELKFLIAVNKSQSADAIEKIKTDTISLMKRALKLKKFSSMELDVDKYADTILNNSLKKALRSPNNTGAIQIAVMRALEAAHPYVDRETVIASRASEAATEYRKRLNKNMIINEKSRRKNKLSGKLDALADRTMDYIMNKVVGQRRTTRSGGADTSIDEVDITRIMTNYNDAHTIRYMMDGKVYRMVLSGVGSEELVKEFYAPENRSPRGILGLASKIAKAKRYLTTSADPTRVLPNLARDWSRGVVMTAGRILLSPKKQAFGVIDGLVEQGYITAEEAPRLKSRVGKTFEIDASRDPVSEAKLKEYHDAMESGLNLAKESIDRSTWTSSMEEPKRNRVKSMIDAAKLKQDANAFERIVWKFQNDSIGKKLATPQDMAESFTRKRAMENAYYDELGLSVQKGYSMDEAVKRATEAAYFYGREATTNFSRRGTLIGKIAELVPYLSQNFSSLESFKYAYLDNPAGVVRSLQATVTTYSALIAIALSNEESRKKYYMLSEYERSNNIIIPLTNDLILTVPLDENIAAFLTPYRRMIETLNGTDPEAFYMWGVDFLNALSPLDLSGFSEGDKFNLRRGLERLGSQTLPTVLLPFFENAAGEDFYYGTNIEITDEYTETYNDNPNPTPGELTTKSNNSKILAGIADATGIPQWQLQTLFTTYGGNGGAYVINILDKMAGATEEEQGGKDFFDAIFKPFTGMESNSAISAMWDGINQLNEDKEKLRKEIKAINKELKVATGDKAEKLEEERQKKITDYGVKVCDFLDGYMSAYEITGGLNRADANRIWYLFNIYDDNDDEAVYAPNSPEAYYQDQINSKTNKRTTQLASISGMDKYVHKGAYDNFTSSYGKKAFEDTVYGVGLQTMSKIAIKMEDTSDYENSFTKMRSDAFEARSAAFDAKDYDLADKIAYEYDYKVLTAIYPYLLEQGVERSLNDSTVMNYIKKWVMVPSSEMRTAKGTYVPSLGKNTQKEEAFKKQFIKKMYGVE